MKASFANVIKKVSAEVSALPKPNKETRRCRRYDNVASISSGKSTFRNRNISRDFPGNGLEFPPIAILTRLDSVIIKDSSNSPSLRTRLTVITNQ